VTLRTAFGLLPGWREEDGRITVDMGAPRFGWQDIALADAADTAALPIEGSPAAVSMGNPHCVFFVEDAEAVDLAMRGPAIETHPLFPERCNVEFASPLGPDHLRVRVWERGAGVTQACGSGACAVAAAAVRRGLTGRRLRLTLDGGDLDLHWPEGGGVAMTGPVAYVFEGELDPAELVP
jgi:diaminopimelate epimerase